MPPQITSASVLPCKTVNTKIAFFARCSNVVREFNQSLLDFFNLFDSQLILTLLYDSLNHVINAFSLGLLRGAWFKRKEVESAAAVQHLDCVACIKHQCAVFWVSSFAR